MENTNKLIKECTGDIIMSICFLGNTCVALSILNNYDVDDNLYNIINMIAYFSLAYPYYILYTRYIQDIYKI